MLSVIQNACQTPVTPVKMLSTYAIGIINKAYLKSEIISESVPFPNPSRAPVAVTDTADTTNPAHNILKALTPFNTVSEFCVNMLISISGNKIHRTVPITIITATIAIAV